MQPFLIGVDWGGTRIKIGSVTLEGAIESHEVLTVDKASGAEDSYNIIVQHLSQLIIKHGKPIAVGLGLTGPTDPDRGVVLLPGKIQGMEGFPIVSRLRDDLKVPVWADNDGRLAMYAERYAGNARAMAGR